MASHNMNRSEAFPCKARDLENKDCRICGERKMTKRIIVIIVITIRLVVIIIIIRIRITDFLFLVVAAIISEC